MQSILYLFSRQGQTLFQAQHAIFVLVNFEYCTPQNFGRKATNLPNWYVHIIHHAVKALKLMRVQIMQIEAYCRQSKFLELEAHFQALSIPSVWGTIVCATDYSNCSEKIWVILKWVGLHTFTPFHAYSR